MKTPSILVPTIKMDAIGIKCMMVTINEIANDMDVPATAHRSFFKLALE